MSRRLSRLSVATAMLLLAGLEAAGIEFIPENGGGPGVRLRANSESPNS